MAATRRRSDRSDEIWPGFVDALSALLMVVFFLLVVFMLAQFFLNVTLSGRNEALDRLSLQVSELAELLSLERQANSDLRLDVAQLSSELQNSVATRDALLGRLSSIISERDALDLQLEAAVDEAKLTAQETEALRAALADANQTIETDRDTLQLRLSELASLRQDIATLRKVRSQLETQVTELALSLDKNTAELTAERDRSLALEARLSDQEERTALAQREIKNREILLDELQLMLRQSDEELTAERDVSVRAANQIVLLNDQIAALREQLMRLSEALDIVEREAKEKGVVISDLGRKLNIALAGKVEELQRYRSEFFGRLRELLGARVGIRIVDDRFVFQSEVLFTSGSATLGESGKAQMRDLATTLLEIAEEIPDDLPWIMRVDGHTDKNPIHTDQFGSNWELSSTRALSVVHYLIAQGVPPTRLAAVGFGEFQPIDPGNDEIGFRRNRRIELKLTSR
jgi:chemotaxis protein MotB